MKKKGILKVKNSSSYVYTPEPIPGGAKRDFFDGDDQAFSRHKIKLIEKTSEISAEVGARDEDNFATLIVSLRDDAVAKSHRPTKALFNEKHPVIGGGDIGQIYVQVNSKSLPQLAERISQAKVQSDVKFDKNGKVQSKVGGLRSEVSAIEDIELFSSQNKCKFSRPELIRMLVEEGRELIIEIFSPKENNTLNVAEIDNLKNKLNEHLKTRLNDIANFTTSKYFSDNILSLSFVGRDLSMEDILFFIKELQSEPIVKDLYPAPSILFSDTHTISKNKVANFPVPEVEKEYPKVALIDSGVRSTLLSNWVKERSDSLGDEVISDFHADEMASILIGSKYLNGFNELEEDGCDIYDIWLPSTTESFDEQFTGFDDFSDWLYLEVQSARELGYRVYSMSINFQFPVSEKEYSIVASRLDSISKIFDVLFVISVGNLESSGYRPEWPKLDTDVFKMLARNKSIDQILQPSECVSALSVGAVNHISNNLITSGVPTRYTRRGPSTAYGIKPDLVHFGGIGDENGSGIKTINGLNNVVQHSHGTSLSAPHIAKTVAVIDQFSNGVLPVNVLKGLLIHNSEIPSTMLSKDLKKEAREFLGFGLAKNSKDIIENEESSFTFVFEDSLKRGQIAEFGFIWPQSLVTNKGKCKGAIRMTLIYTPPINKSFGQEYVRANVEASLQQEKINNHGESSFKKEVHSIWDTKLGEEANYEKNLIKHGFKWWPSKVYQRSSKHGFGNSTNWRLRVTSQVRDGVVYPEAGIEFAVIVTIQDESKESNKVYQEMLINLRSIGVEVDEIQIKEEIRT
jgi:hypothetical protein